jgi:hypothetical protein
MDGLENDTAGRLRGRRERKPHAAVAIALVALVSLAAVGCSSTNAEQPASADAGTTGSSPVAPSDRSPTQTVRDIAELPDFAPVEPGTYSVDPDSDASTPLRVMYRVPVEGWSEWFGAVKFAGDERVAVSITTVTNLVRHGCRDHRPADPPVGPSVDDLAAALADLAPFRVTSPPEDVTIHGYSGKHLELSVPDLPVRAGPDDLSFVGCGDGNLHSWISPPNDGAFYGYGGPRNHEEFWILDVEGTRLMIVALRSAGAPREDMLELRAILDSIRIEP